MRGDDSVGRRAAHALEALYRDNPNVEVVSVHQLTPELAEDVSRSDFVLFLDAAVADAPGAIRKTNVSAVAEPQAFSHHLTPPSLLAAAASLYGDSPQAVSLTLTSAAFHVGKKLSPLVEAEIRRFIDQAREVVEAHLRIRELTSSF
jgi:hydrogenase maturation protease